MCLPSSLHYSCPSLAPCEQGQDSQSPLRHAATGAPRFAASSSWGAGRCSGAYIYSLTTSPTYQPDIWRGKFNTVSWPLTAPYLPGQCNHQPLTQTTQNPASTPMAHIANCLGGSMDPDTEDHSSWLTYIGKGDFPQPSNESVCNHFNSQTDDLCEVLPVGPSLHIRSSQIATASSSSSSSGESKPFAWRMQQTERKYQLFPKGPQTSVTTGKALDPEQAFALAMGEKGEKSTAGAGLRIRIKEHNLIRRRKISVPELGPMTTVQEIAMDSRMFLFESRMLK